MIPQLFKNELLSEADNIFQWLERNTFKRESISQHSYKHSVFCLILLEELFSKNSEGLSVMAKHSLADFKSAVLAYSILHDWDELVTKRDFSHTMKYNTHNGEEVRDVIDNYVDYKIKEVIPQGFKSTDFIVNTMTDPSVLVKRFCKIADYLAMIHFCKVEIELGNKKFIKNFNYCCEKLFESIKIFDETIKMQNLNLALFYSPDYFSELNQIPTKPHQ